MHLESMWQKWVEWAERGTDNKYNFPCWVTTTTVLILSFTALNMDTKFRIQNCPPLEWGKAYAIYSCLPQKTCDQTLQYFSRWIQTKYHKVSHKTPPISSCDWFFQKKRLCVVRTWSFQILELSQESWLVSEGCVHKLVSWSLGLVRLPGKIPSSCVLDQGVEQTQ